MITAVKVHIFSEGHKILRNLHRRFVLRSNGQTYDGNCAKFCGLLRIYELCQNSNSTSQRFQNIIRRKTKPEIGLKIDSHKIQK